MGYGVVVLALIITVKKIFCSQQNCVIIDVIIPTSSTCGDRILTAKNDTTNVA